MLSAPIPQPLRETIERESAQFKTLQLATAAEELSAAYRAQVPARLESAVARAAYRLTRQPATYAALWAASRELGFAPASWLDLGAGPGTAAYVAEPLGARVTLVEQNRHWLGSAPAEWVCADLRRLPPLPSHDVVSICYVLNELAAAEQERLVVEAWSLAGRALLVLEPGTVEGSGIVRRAREQLIALGAHIQAPCPHERACPLEAPDWCHFAVRVERSRAQRLAKGGELGYEDEKFSYLLALKEAADPCRQRVLRHPRQQPKYIQLRLCDRQKGLLDWGVGKKEKALWHAARRSSWGARLEPDGYHGEKPAEGDASQAE